MVCGVVFCCEVLAVEAGSHLLLPSNSTSNSTTEMWFCWRESCHRVKETCFLLLPSIKFPLYKRKWNKKKLKSFECLSPFPTVYFLSWLLVGRPKSIPQWSRSCDLDHRPVKSMDFYWWWSENLSLVNSVSSHLCSGIIWWVDRSEKQQQEAFSSITYIYFTWNKVFWVPLETFLLPGLSAMVCYL